MRRIMTICLIAGLFLIFGASIPVLSEYDSENVEWTLTRSGGCTIDITATPPSVDLGEAEYSADPTLNNTGSPATLEVFDPCTGSGLEVKVRVDSTYFVDLYGESISGLPDLDRFYVQFPSESLSLFDDDSGTWTFTTEDTWENVHTSDILIGTASSGDINHFSFDLLYRYEVDSTGSDGGTPDQPGDYVITLQYTANTL